MLLRELVEKVVGQHQQIGLPIAKRRHEDREHVEAIVQVFAERPRRDSLLHIFVGGGEETDVHFDGFRAAEALELALLQHAEQLHLRREGQIADLIEKERAAFGQLEAPLLSRVGAREGALLIPEELRLDEAVGQRRATHFDERFLRPQRVVVDRMRDELLARARFSADEHGRIGRRDLRDLLVHLPHRSARPDDVGEIVPIAELLPQVGVLVHQAFLVFLDQALKLDRLRDHRRDDAEELDAAVVVALRLEPEIHAEGADRAAVQDDRYAHEAQLLVAELGAARRAVKEPRLAAHPGYDNGLACFDDAPRDALPHPVLDGLRRPIEAVGGFHAQLAAFSEKGHDASDGAVMACEDLEHAVQRRLEVERARQRLAHLEQRRQAPGLASLPRRGGDGLRFQTGHSSHFFHYPTLLYK